MVRLPLAAAVRALALSLAVIPASHAATTARPGLLQTAALSAQADAGPVSTATTAIPAAANPSGPILPTPLAYARIALDFIEQAAYRVPLVDWAAVRARAEQRVESAATIADTYPIITDALKGLGDRHSSFTGPPQAVQQTAGKYNGFGFLAVLPSRIVVTVAPGSPAELAGLLVGDRIDKVDGRAPLRSGGAITVARDRNGNFPARITLTVLRKDSRNGNGNGNENGNGRRKVKTIVVKQGEVTLVSVPQTVPVPLTLGEGLAYIEVPGIVGDDAAQRSYASQLQAIIRTADAPARCGWIIDLRRNRGGYIFAMLAGLGPILGDGLLGGKRDAKGQIAKWTYAAGVVLEDANRTVAADSPYTLTHTGPPVAVLTSGLSASAAEAVAIAFRGRPLTRSFGEATLGLPTFNSRRTMPDGAFLDVMTNVDVDRLGNTYDAAVPVDERVAIDWSNIGNDRDPVLAAAARWLEAQPACSAG